MTTLQNNNILFTDADMLLDSDVSFSILKTRKWKHAEKIYASATEAENALLFVQLLNTLMFSDRLVCKVMHEYSNDLDKRQAFAEYFNQYVKNQDYFFNGKLDLQFLKVEVNRLWLKWTADVIAKSVINFGSENITFEIL